MRDKYTQDATAWSIDQEHRELLADVLLGDVDVYLGEVLDKKWFGGGKIRQRKELWDFLGCETWPSYAS